MSISLPSKILLQSAKEVLLAQRHTRHMRAIVIPLQLAILQAGEFHSAINGARVIDVRRIYDINDQDFTRFVELQDNAYKELGFELPSGNCPLLMAENSERQAIDRLIVQSKELIEDLDIEWLYRSMSHYQIYVSGLMHLLTTHFPL